MRILHTSDWHLGRTFGGRSLLHDQGLLVDRLVELVRSEGVHLVAVAGDVYDRAVPPAEAVALFRSALVRLRDAGARVVVVAGNHDGPDRLAAYDGLTDLAGVHVRGGAARAGEPVVVREGHEELVVVPVPFLDPVLTPDDADPAARTGEAGPGPRPSRTHAAVLAGPLSRARAAVAGRASLVVAHAFVAGGVGSDSERDVTVGGADVVPVSLFAGFSYVALGHLHAAQQPAAHVRYAGSPLPYSFSETAPKQVVLVDIASDGTTVQRAVALGVGRPVATVTGRMDALLTDPAHEGLREHWVRARLTDPGVVLDAKRRLAERFPHVAQIELVPEQHHVAGPAGVPAGSGRTPVELARAFWSATQGGPPAPPEHDLLVEALAHARSQEAAA